MEKPKRKRKGQRWPWWKRILLVLVVLMGFAIIGYYFIQWQVYEFYRETVVELQGEAAYLRAEELLGVDFPDEARDFYTYDVFWQDGHIQYGEHIRFETPADLGLDWLSDAPCFELFTRDPSMIFVAPRYEIDWWQPQAADSLLVSRCEAEDVYYSYIDQTDPNTWIVYIQIQ